MLGWALVKEGAWNDRVAVVHVTGVNNYPAHGAVPALVNPRAKTSLPHPDTATRSQGLLQLTLNISTVFNTEITQLILAS